MNRRSPEPEIAIEDGCFLPGPIFFNWMAIQSYQWPHCELAAHQTAFPRLYKHNNQGKRGFSRKWR